MTPRRKFLIALGIVLVGGLVAWASTRENEPVYQGKTLSQWMVVYDPQDQKNTQTQKAVQAMGTNAIPTLVKWISYDEPMARKKVRGFYSSLPLQVRQWRWLASMVMSDDQREVRSIYALQGFRILGARATNALPALRSIERQISTSFLQARIECACQAICADAVRLKLAAVIADRERNFGPVMGEFKVSATNGSPQLLGLFALAFDSDPRFAALACELIGDLPIDPRYAVRTLTDALSATDPRVRIACIKGLVHFDPAQCRYTDAIQRMLQDVDPGVREAATNALGRITPGLLGKAVD